MTVEVTPIPATEVLPWILDRHYACRRCPVSFSFGAWRDKSIIGIVTYGVPASDPLRRGICGDEWSDKVLELNRLCCENTRNIASLLVGRSLRMLPKPRIVVSFADTAQGHIGYVYQATNFLYTGLSARRTNWKIRGREHIHGVTVADISRGKPNRSKWMRDKYGEDFYLEDRPRKHRYVFFCGSRKQKTAMRQALRYQVEPYPKGETKRTEYLKKIETQMAF